MKQESPLVKPSFQKQLIHALRARAAGEYANVLDFLFSTHPDEHPETYVKLRELLNSKAKEKEYEMTTSEFVRRMSDEDLDAIDTALFVMAADCLSDLVYGMDEIGRML